MVYAELQSFQIVYCGNEACMTTAHCATQATVSFCQAVKNANIYKIKTGDRPCITENLQRACNTKAQ